MIIEKHKISKAIASIVSLSTDIVFDESMVVLPSEAKMLVGNFRGPISISIQ